MTQCGQVKIVLSVVVQMTAQAKVSAITRLVIVSLVTLELIAPFPPAPMNALAMENALTGLAFVILDLWALIAL